MAPSTQLEIRLSCMALSVFPAGPPPLPFSYCRGQTPFCRCSPIISLGMGDEIICKWPGERAIWRRRRQRDELAGLSS